jgi:hypothetical protein
VTGFSDSLAELGGKYVQCPARLVVMRMEMILAA